jgi:hypothetical protein
MKIINDDTLFFSIKNHANDYKKSEFISCAEHENT